MRRFPRVESEDDGLGSLLDTMTNVVGILVLVLIATQLGVKEAVDRIADSDLVTPEAVKETQNKLKLTKEHRDMLEAQLADAQETDTQTLELRLEELRRKRDTARHNLQQEQQKTNAFAARIDDQKKKAKAASDAIADSVKAKQEYDQLAKEVTRGLEEEATLKAQLSKTPAQKAPPAKIVTLPDPRPAPQGIKPLYLLCAHNKLYRIADDDMRAIARKRAEFVVQSKGLFGGPQIGVNKEEFFRHFAKAARTLTDEFFSVEVYAAGIYPRLRFQPHKRAGATLKEVSSPRSRFQKSLAGIDPRKYYARFIVLPDSYEVYLAARTAVNQKGILAGWEPQAADWQFTTHLGGSLLFGPKPPPAKPNPNPPKNPPKPPNVID